MSFDASSQIDTLGVEKVLFIIIIIIIIINICFMLSFFFFVMNFWNELNQLKERTTTTTYVSN